MDISGLWTGSITKSPRDEFIYYTAQGELEGLRQGDWKLLVRKQGQQKKKQQPQPPQKFLFDLAADLGEQQNLASEHADVVAALEARMLELDEEITANAREPWIKP